MEALSHFIHEGDTMVRGWWDKRDLALWAVIGGGLVMGAAVGIRHVQGLFLVPMTMDRGWTRETFAFALAIQNLCWGLAQPFTGMIADRWGSLRVLAVGVVLYALGLGFMAVVTTPLGLFLSAGLLVGVAQSCTAFGAVYGAISRIVPAPRRSRSLGAAGAFSGLCQFAAVPLTQTLQNGAGWANALIALGLLIALLLPACWLLNDRQPRSAGVSNTGTAVIGAPLSLRAAIREAFAHPGFWLLSMGFLACGFQLAFIASHLPAYLLDKGVRPQVAVTGLAIVALSNVLGTWLCGHFGGIYRRKHLLALIYLARVSAMALFVLLPTTPATVYAFCAVMGLLWLGTVPLTNGLVSQVFGVQYITTLFGFVFFGHQLGSFLGVWMGGWVYDRTHSYDLVWVIAMGLGVVSAALHWPVDDRPAPRLRQAAAVA